MQRSERSSQTRAVLSIRLHLEGQEHQPFRAAGKRGGNTRESFKLQEFRELVNEWVDLAVELEQDERATTKEHGD